MSVMSFVSVRRNGSVTSVKSVLSVTRVASVVRFTSVASISSSVRVSVASVVSDMNARSDQCWACATFFSWHHRNVQTYLIFASLRCFSAKICVPWH